MVIAEMAKMDLAAGRGSVRLSGKPQLDDLNGTRYTISV